MSSVWTNFYSWDPDSNWVIFFPHFISVWNRMEHQYSCMMTEGPLKSGNTLQQESLKLSKSLLKEIISVSCELFLTLWMRWPWYQEEMMNLLAMETSQKIKAIFFHLSCVPLLFYKQNFKQKWACGLGLFVCLLGRGCLVVLGFFLWKVILFKIYTKW